MSGRLDLDQELARAGWLARGEAAEHVHRTDGPLAVTACCRTRSGLAWIEHEHDRSPAAADASVVAVLRQVLGPTPWAALPVLTSGGTAVYGPLPGAHLLVDRLLPDADLPPAVVEPAARCHAELGARLAELHARPTGDARLRPLLRSHVLVEEVRRLVTRAGRPQPTLALERLQELVLCEHGELAIALAEACCAFDRCPHSSLLHGRACPAYASAPDDLDPARLRMLGWLDAAIGPAAFDVGWWVGEMLELVDGREHEDGEGRRALTRLAAGFLRAYLAAGGESSARFLADVDAFAALKVVSHVVAFVRGFGFAADLVGERLRMAERVLAEGWALRVLEAQA